MWKRLGFRFGKFCSNKPFTTTAISTCLAATIITTSNTDKSQRIESNRILSDRHRIALAEWPVIRADMRTDLRVNTLDRLISYLSRSGYEGIEMSLENFKELYFNKSSLSNEEITEIIKQKFDKSNLRIFGILCHSRDEDWTINCDKYLSNLRESLYFNKKLGVEYVTFQIWLPDKYQTNDGSYRNDSKLLNEFIERINILKNICFDFGLNFYVETHVGRISEDPQAFVEGIIEQNPYSEFELNGDLSHFICRGILKGPYIDTILSKMEHTHVRMARIYGDISVNVDDPINDWNNPNGVTNTYWNFTKKGFQNGLSSRVIVGEAGPKHLVNDPLKQDQKMVPLLKAMAKYCDKEIEQTKFDKPDFNPFQQTL